MTVCYILKMGRPRQGVRGLNSSEGRAAQEFGRKLYDAIFQGEVRDCLRSSLNAVSQQTDQGLRLRLRLSDAPTLAELPWEYLYDTSFRRFFAHSAATPIVRYLDLPERIQPLAVQPPLKILVMIASPRDYGKLDVEAEWRKVQEAFGDLVQRGLVTLTRLERATLTALQRQLRREQYHIFHFIGHGGFDQQSQEGVLLLEDENGLTRLVAGSYIGALLHDHRYQLGDGRENPEPADCCRVVRGGSWNDYQKDVRSAAPHLSFPDYRYHVVGLRVVWSPDP